MRVKPLQLERIVHESEAIVLILLCCPRLPALAHHPGADLDKLMGSEEKFFQAIDEPAAPPFELADADGKVVRLSDFSDKIVVLNFIFASCTDLCPIHSEVIADIQEKINDTPMKDRVQFLTVTTDPARIRRRCSRPMARRMGWMRTTGCS